MENILPIGSVVQIKGCNKPVMIFGFLQLHPSNTDILYDYVGVPYPEGNMDVRMHIGFQREDIENVIFTGYINKEFNEIVELFKMKK